jgi:hypothetical protein
MTTTDPTTQSNYTAIRTCHVDLVWTLDWDSKRILGSATHHLRASEDNVKEVMLVTRIIIPNLETDIFNSLDTSFLDISKVEVGGESVKVRSES